VFIPPLSVTTPAHELGRHVAACASSTSTRAAGPALLPACMIESGTRHEGRHRVGADERRRKTAVLEFLLINHPLDLPGVRTRAASGPLQDNGVCVRSRRVAVRRGEAALREADSRQRRRVSSTVSGASCANRCTRFADEVAGDPLIHFLKPRQRDRGQQPSPDHPFASYFSGNTVQICPVGALTAKPFPLPRPVRGISRRSSRRARSCSVGLSRDDRGEPQPRAALTRGVDVDPVNWGWFVRQGPLRLRSHRVRTIVCRNHSSARTAS